MFRIIMRMMMKIMMRVMMTIMLRIMMKIITRSMIRYLKIYIYKYISKILTSGHDGIPAQAQSTGLKYKPKDRKTISSVYQSLNLQKSGGWIENKT